MQQVLRLARAVLLPVCAALAALPAQGSPRPRGTGRDLLPRQTPASAIAGIMESDGALLGVGRRYRATFGAAGVEYQPALGRHAPRAATWRVALDAVRIGESTVLDCRGVRPTRAHDRRAVVYGWPGVDERYEARSDGLAQSFVLADRPSADGDLVVRLRVDADLPRAGDGAFAWLAEGLGGVTIGEVTGIDANGARCRGERRHTADGVEYVLPAAFVAAAAFPLCVDPLIGTATEALAGADCDFPDVAYDAGSGSYCVVWTQFFGGGTTGAVAAVFRASDLQFAYAFAVNQPGDEDSVRVCNIAGTGLYVMMWTNRQGGATSVSGLAFEPVQAQASGVFTLAGPGASAPALSGEATVLDDDCLVVWQDATFGLLGTSLAFDAQLVPSATPIVQIAGGNATEAAISKQGGNDGRHVVTWVDRPPGLPGWVRAQAVDHDMNLLGPGVWIQQAPQNSAFPAVDGDGFLFLLAWEEQEVANPSATDVRGRLITVGPGGVTSQGGTLELAQYPNDLDIAADVALLGDRFGLVYESQIGPVQFGDDVFFRAIARTGEPIGDEVPLDLASGGGYQYEHAPRLIGRRDGDPGTAADDGLVVFADQSVTSGDSNVALQAVESMGPGGAVADLGGGCGPGGLAVANGPCALGNAAFRFELFGAAPMAVPFALLALPGPRQTCAACSVLQPLAIDFTPNTAGTASRALPLPGESALLGLTVECQWLTFFVAYTGCPFAPGMAASNVVAATIGQ